MKSHVCAVLALAAASAFPMALCAQELLRIPSYDGEIIEGQLQLPPSGDAAIIVIDVPSSGPHTYQNRRQVGRSTVFNFHDYFATEFARRGIAYFSYSTRYTHPDSIPPYFDRVDREKFLTYTPSTKVQDVESVVRFLKKDPRLVSSRVVLLGWSSGAIIASLVAERGRVPLDALVLAGAPADDVYDVIRWQLSGAASMIVFRRFLDDNGDGIVQRSEYERADPRAIARVGGRPFEELDVDGDSTLTVEDFHAITAPRLQQVLAAVEAGDDDWIWESYFRVGTKWINEHRALEPNRTRILGLDIPVFLFHGENDANAPVEGIREMEAAAKEQGKDNLHFFVFAGHDHSLEFLSWVVRDTMPEALVKLFEVVEGI